MNRVQFERILTGIETGFNVLGSTPLGIATGAIRMVLGQAQVIASFAYTLFAAIAESVASDPKKQAYYKSMYLLGSEHMVHGVANMIRGFFETTKFGQIFFAVTQIADKNFKPRICPYQNWKVLQTQTA